jgi:hypothetical protein
MKRKQKVSAQSEKIYANTQNNTFLSRIRVAGEADARPTGISHIPEAHRLHIHCGSEQS